MLHVSNGTDFVKVDSFPFPLSSSGTELMYQVSVRAKFLTTTKFTLYAIYERVRLTISGAFNWLSAQKMPRMTQLQQSLSLTFCPSLMPLLLPTKRSLCMQAQICKELGFKRIKSLHYASVTYNLPLLYSNFLSVNFTHVDDEDASVWVESLPMRGRLIYAGKQASNDKLPLRVSTVQCENLYLHANAEPQIVTPMYEDYCWTAGILLLRYVDLKLLLNSSKTRFYI